MVSLIRYLKVIVILFFILSGCRIFSPSGSGVIPQVTIVTPQDGDTIKIAHVVIRAEVTSKEDILKVKFFDDNLFLGEVQTYPYEHLWETAFVSNGEHKLSAEAVDESGNTGRSSIVSVLVTKEDLYDWDLFSSPTSNNLNALFAYNSLNIWVCGNSGSILFYDNSAWQIQTIPNNSLFDIFLISQDRGWCVGENVLLEFNNGVWSLLATFEKEKFISIFIFNDTTGWVGDYEGRIFTFSGDSLEVYDLLDTMPITDILGFTPSDLWASCGNSLFHYDGVNWLLDTTFADEYINSLYSPDGSSIWAAGTHLFYYDGVVWEMKELPSSIGTDCEVKAIYFSTPNDGVACGIKGENGFVISYNGVEWKEESIQKDIPLYGINRFSNGEGWAVGYRGAILHSKGK